LAEFDEQKEDEKEEAERASERREERRQCPRLDARTLESRVSGCLPRMPERTREDVGDPEEVPVETRREKGIVRGLALYVCRSCPLSLPRPHRFFRASLRLILQAD
jgi:hypothetical protein